MLLSIESQNKILFIFCHVKCMKIICLRVLRGMLLLVAVLTGCLQSYSLPLSHLHAAAVAAATQLTLIFFIFITSAVTFAINRIDSSPSYFLCSLYFRAWPHRGQASPDS